MASAAGNRPRRGQGAGLPVTPLSRYEAGGETRGRPAPIGLRWCRTLALANGTSAERLSCWTPVVAVPKPNAGRRQTVANPRFELGPALQVLQVAVRQALAGLDGPWSARIEPLEAFCVDIAAPDGFRWLASIPDPRRQGTKAVARRLKDACRQGPPSSRLARWKKAWIIVTEGLS
jgi:hypothetical protein